MPGEIGCLDDSVSEVEVVKLLVGVATVAVGGASGVLRTIEQSLRLL